MTEAGTSQRRLVVRGLGLAAWTIALLWLSLTPDPPGPTEGFLGWDKLHHAVAYALLTVLSGRFLAALRPVVRRPWLLAATYAFVFGVLMEIAQGLFTTVRQPDVRDAAADLVGAFAVCLIVRLWRWQPRRG
jgi:VanZ family protein